MKIVGTEPWRHASATDKRSAVRLLVVFWGGFFLLYTVRAIPAGFGEVLIAVPRRLVASAIGGLISWLIYLALRGRTRGVPTRWRFVLLAALSVAAGTIFAVANSVLFYLLLPLTGETCLYGRPCTVEELVSVAQSYAVNWTFLFAAWCLLITWLDSVGQVVDAESRALEERASARIAEIRALRYQVNPHFLFNCLNSLATLARRPDKAEAEAMIGELGAFLRYGLATDPLTDVNLCDEVAMQERYLALEQRRFAHRMTVHIDIDEGARLARVPSLILQPLVENAIKHGVSVTAAQTTVSIRATVQGDRLSIIVDDDAWPDPRKSALPGADGFGIGLRNVSDRLAARYGPTASCIAAPLPHGGFRAELSMPMVTK